LNGSSVNEWERKPGEGERGGRWANGCSGGRGLGTGAEGGNAHTNKHTHVHTNTHTHTHTNIQSARALVRSLSIGVGGVRGEGGGLPLCVDDLFSSSSKGDEGGEGGGSRDAKSSNVKRGKEGVGGGVNGGSGWLDLLGADKERGRARLRSLYYTFELFQVVIQ